MLDYLARHARQHVWCTPDQDLQAIFQPARITPTNGLSGKAPVMWGEIALPTADSRYHVYQIGQIHPRLLGLMADCCTWTSFATLCSRQNLIVDLYVRSGVQFPRCESYLLVGKNRTLFIAVRVNPAIADLNTNPLYVRLYSNAYFNSTRRLGDDRIVVKGQRITSRNDQLLLQRSFHDHQALRGYAYAFVNGRLVHDITPTNCQVGDVAEFVYDSSIFRVVDLPVEKLLTFNSKLDLKRKYLIHYPALENRFIEYLDDIDFWLLQPIDNDKAKFSGVYYHKNQPDAVRMLTHKDYSIPVDYLMAYIEEHPVWTDPMKTILRMHVRKSGYERPLIDEHQRIKELYKLDPEDVERALLGIDSTVEEWRADNLELSGYTAMMSHPTGEFDRKVVQDSYGYNAITKLLADTPQRVSVVGQRRLVRLPYLLREQSTVYEYDDQGRLLGFYLHLSGEEYTARHTNTAYVEVMRGIGSTDQGTVFGDTVHVLPDGVDHRFYICPVINGVPTEEWQDVTGKPGYYELTGNQLRWTVDQSRFLPAYRGNHKHLVYRLQLSSEYGLIKFTINANEPRYGIRINRPATIPPRRLDVWMNGYSLIENLDYYVRWPEVVICNKTFLSEAPTQDIVIRCSGFCDENMQREAPAEVGFVEHGLMSRNRRYDIRDDKVLRIVVDGRLRLRDELKFSEDDAGVRMENVRNGAPYVIDEPAIPLYGLIETDTQTFRERSRAVDRKISDYLTVRLPEPEIPEPSIIPHRHVVFSPFCSRIMHDLQRGVLGGPEIQGHYADGKLWEWLADYLYILDYDPTQKDVNSNYVEIHPHNYPYVTELNIYQYTFLERVVRVILNGRVNLSGHIRMGELTNG